MSSASPSSLPHNRAPAALLNRGDREVSSWGRSSPCVYAVTPVMFMRDNLNPLRSVSQGTPMSNLFGSSLSLCDLHGSRCSRRSTWILKKDSPELQEVSVGSRRGQSFELTPSSKESLSSYSAIWRFAIISSCDLYTGLGLIVIR